MIRRSTQTRSKSAQPAIVRHRRTRQAATYMCCLFALAAISVAGIVQTASAHAAGAPHPATDYLGLVLKQQAEFLDPSPGAYDMFGFSVAVSGNTAVVGARTKTVDGHDYAGAAYVYVRSGATWSQQAVLSAADVADGTCFGSSVAISGDTIVVGAVGTIVDAKSYAGAAYVFTRTGTTWSQQTKLTEPVTGAGDSFGNSVAVSGNIAVVGAWQTTGVAGAYAGAAYVSTRTGTTWSVPATLTPLDASAGAYFGTSVAVSGTTAVVGAREMGIAGHVTGAAYVFALSGTSWPQQAELTASDGANADWFGSSVAVSGNTALIGAQHVTVSGQSWGGAAYVFTRSGTIWSQQTKLSDPVAATGDRFGAAVAVSGNVAVVGAYNKSLVTNGAGAAYFFTRAGTLWSQPWPVVASDAASNDEFGWSVGLAGNTAVIGAQWKTVGGQPEAGAAYIDVIPGKPSLTLKASPTTVKVGRTVTLTGVVKNSVAAVRTVMIERKVGTKMTVLKKVTLTKSGSFKAYLKPGKIGKWVLVACYKVGKTAYLSKAVVVTVHK